MVHCSQWGVVFTRITYAIYFKTMSLNACISPPAQHSLNVTTFDEPRKIVRHDYTGKSIQGGSALTLSHVFPTLEHIAAPESFINSPGLPNASEGCASLGGDGQCLQLLRGSQGTAKLRSHCLVRAEEPLPG